MRWFGRKAGRVAARPFLLRGWPAAAGELWPRSYEAQVREAYLGNPVAQRAVRLVSESVGGASVYEQNKERPSGQAGSGQAAALVSGPLLETAAAQLLLHGNAFLQILLGAEGEPAELFALRPERVSVEADAAGWPTAYAYKAGEAKTRLAARDGLGRPSLVHLKAMHPLDDHYGLGCLGAAAGAVAIHNAATRYSYSASFAVALSGRRIRNIRRIWADGKLLRGAAGDFKSQTKYRLHLGDEGQNVDPIISSVEGAANAPAHRGIAYAVFEDFELADYGNRIPSLTFEVEADAGAVAIGAVAEELTDGEVRAGETPSVGGYAVSGDSVRGAIEALSEVVPVSLREIGDALQLTAAVGTALSVNPEDCEAIGAGRSAGRTELSRRAAAAIPAEVAISYYDVARDYQTGLQRAGRGGAAFRGERATIAAALTAEAAKGFAERRLAHLWAARETAKLHLSWRRSGLRPGSHLQLGGRGGLWKIGRWSLDHMVVELELIRVPPSGHVIVIADPGRPTQQPDLTHGPTTLFLLELPVVSGAAPSAPLVVAAAAGKEAGWRSAVLAMGLDGGAWEAIGTTAGSAILGHARAVLGPGESALLDLTGSVEVELLSDDMWLEGRDDGALAAGANAAMLGSELIQFGAAEPLGNRRFRLARLLRGRRGTEWAASMHSAGEPFALLEAEHLAPISLAAGSVGGELRVMASGIGDLAAPPVATLLVEGRALQPPSPVHLTAEAAPNGDIVISWVRRSRSGWAWLGGSDTPVGEEVEAYRLVLTGPGFERRIDLTAPNYTYTAAEQVQDAWSGQLDIRAFQIGTHALSRAAEISIG